MQTEWIEIPEFPGYSVSDTGFVRNDETDRIMTKLVNQRGVVHVGLTKKGIQYKRGLSILVAEAFLIRPSFAFDTPINLDGDRYNNHVLNLLWRPRWFAVKYFQQFQQDAPCFNRPVQITETNEVYASSWDASTSLGLLDREVAMSIMSKTYVWPIYQHFRLLK